MATYADPGANPGTPPDGGAPLRLEDLFDGPGLRLGETAPAARLTFAGGVVDLTAFDTQPVSGSESR